MRKTFKYRLYPTSAQIKCLEKTFDLNRFLYNSALEERISFYKTFKKSLSYISQANQLSGIKSLMPEFNKIHSQVLQSTLKRLDLAYKSFFRRIKSGETAGFPRFKKKAPAFRQGTFTAHINLLHSEQAQASFEAGESFHWANFHLEPF